MRFAFTDDQLMFRDATRDMFHQSCTAARVRETWNSEHGFVPELWSTLAGMEILGMMAPESEQGLGLSELDVVLMLEEAGKVAFPLPLMEHTLLAVPLLATCAPASFREVWLPQVLSGQALLGVGLEQAPLVSGANYSKILMIQQGKELVGLLTADVELQHQASVDGSRRLFRVRWQPEQEQFRVAGTGVEQALETANYRGALGSSAMLVGLAQQLLDTTVEYVKVRKQFGTAIGAFQAVKHHLANAAVQLNFARPMVYRAAYGMAGKSVDRYSQVAMAKAMSSEASKLVATIALQCHGAIGYSFEYDLHLWMKRVWALAAVFGDARTHRARLAALLLDRPSEQDGHHLIPFG
jgi:alkylation response protein AidB-like acyl-CoA dehydrogenase